MASRDSIRRARPLLGTFVEIEIADASRLDLGAAIDAAFGAVALTHRLMSFHNPESDLSRLNREAGTRPTRVHAWTYQVLEAAIDFHRRSSGAFDVAVAPALQALGLLPASKNDGVLVSRQLLPDLIELLPDNMVRFGSAALTLDFGGIAKGFAVDRAVDVLRDANLSRGMVNAGGDLRAFGQEPHLIHIRDPRDPSRSIGQVEIRNEALATSARRFDLMRGEIGSLAIIDPRTQKLAGPIEGVSVRAPCCMIADALTKIVMILGTDAIELLEGYSASALLISADGDVQITSDSRHTVSLEA